MLNLKDDSGKPLPYEDRKRVSDFIYSLKSVPWFSPSPTLKKEDVERQARFTLDCFGVKAEIEYRKLRKGGSWASAWGSAWASVRDSACDSAWDSACDSACDSAWDSAWDSAFASAWDFAFASALASARVSALASREILLENDENFKEKYPNGAFKQLLELWKMGLFPVGVLEENKKFVICVPPSNNEFLKDFE